MHGGGYRCQGCGLFGGAKRTYKYCAYCSVAFLGGPIRHKKEQEVVDYLNTHVDQKLVYDKAADGNLCLRYRPDILYDLPGHAVIIEVDEEAHQDERHYPKSCEVSRMHAIALSLGKRTVFLRYNPDPIRGETGKVIRKVRKSDRLAHLLTRVVYHLANTADNYDKELTIQYLFYPEAN